MVKLRQLQHQHQAWEVERLVSLEQKFQQQQYQLDQMLSIAETPVRPLVIEVVNPAKTVKEPIRPLTDRVMIFIDEANLYHAALERGMTINYASSLLPVTLLI